MSRVSARFIIFGSGTDQVNATYIPANYTPVNYTPVQVGTEGTNKVSAHLKGIDTSFLPLAGGTLTGRVFMPDGTAALPSLAFTNATTTGFYKQGTNALGIATAGTLRVTLDTANLTTTLPILAPVGAVGGPSYSFSGDATTGIYHPAASQVAVAIAGTQVLLLTATVAQFAQNISAPVGAVGTPAYTFTGRTTDGLYSPAANQLGVTLNGVQQLLMTTSANTFAQVLVLPVGSAGTPSIGFTGDLVTGLYHPAANTVAITTNSTQRLTVNTASVTSTLPFLAPAGTKAAPAYSFSGDTSSGIYSVTSGQVGLSASNTLMLWASNASVVTGASASGAYQTTNGGSVLTANVVLDAGGSLTAGNAWVFDSTGVSMTRSNGSFRIARVQWQLFDLNDAGGSEAGGIKILTQTAGAAPVDNLRVYSGGQVAINASNYTGATPSSRLAVFASGTDNGISIAYFGTANVPIYNAFLARGTIAAPTAVQANDVLGNFRAKGQYDSTVGHASGEAIAIKMVAAEAFSATANGTYMQFWTTLQTTTSPVERLRLTDNGQMQLYCGMAATASNTTNVSGTYSIVATDLILLVDTSVARSITLPAPSQRRILYIKDKTGTAETNNITILRNASEQIEGLAASKVLQTNWGSWIFVSDGTNWFML